jgi:6-phosphogluconolactonase
MKIVISHRPEEVAGEWLSASLSFDNAFCLLAGGSAIDIFSHINLPDECRTMFMMGDERWSREPAENNYEQYKEAHIEHINFPRIVDTSAKEFETFDEYVERLNEIFLKQSIHKNVVALLGIGADGHTAGIFPGESDWFMETYEAEQSYVPVKNKGLKIDSRASVTPEVLIKTSQIIAFAIGENKRDILKKLVHEDHSVVDLPASIIKNHPNSVLITDQAVA